MTTLSRKQNSSRYHFNIACSIYLCYNNRDPILVNHPLFPFSFNVQFSITCKLSLFYRIISWNLRQEIDWFDTPFVRMRHLTSPISTQFSLKHVARNRLAFFCNKELIALTWTSSTPRKSHKTNRRTSLTDRYLPWTHYLQEARVCINGQIYT